MATNFPTSADTAATVGGDSLPAAGTALSDSTAGHPAHSDLHENVGDAVQAVEAKVGTGASTPAANTVLTGTGSGTSGWATVATAMIAADAVDGTKIADDAVDSEHIAAGAIDSEHIAADQVTQAKIAAGAVGTTELAADAVTGAKIADDAVASEHLATDSVTADAIAAGAVDTAELAADAVTAAKIADNAVGNDQLIASPTFTTVTATNLAGTLTTAAQANITSVGSLTGLDVNGVVKVNDGSAAAPTFTFDSDEDSGLYLSGTGVSCAFGGSTAWVATGSAVHPGSDNTKSLGTTDWRWTAVYATNGTIQTSDMALKERKGDALGLDFVNDLEPFQGRWKDEDDAACRQFLSAQDVHRSLEAAGVDPEDSGMWHDGEHEGLNYAEMVPVLVKAVQELTARLEAVGG